MNQEDVAERNAQVAVMGRIYEVANHVAIFLGNRSEDSDLIMDFLAMFQIDNDPIGESKQEFPLNFEQMRELSNLFKRPWFNHAWVLQEVFKCPTGNAFIACGNNTFLARKSLSKILMETRDFGSIDPRDELFALLLLLKDAAKEGLFADIISALLMSLPLWQLQVSSPANSLASWVPDWNQQYKQKQSHPNPSSSFCAGGPFCDAKTFVSRQQGENSPAALNAFGFIVDVVDGDLALPCRPDDIEEYNLQFLIDTWDVTKNMEGGQTVRKKVVAEDELQQSVYDSHPFLYSMTKAYSHPMWEIPQEFRYPQLRPDPDSMSRIRFICTMVAAGGEKDEYGDFSSACGITFRHRKLWQSKEKFMAWKKSVQGAMLGRKLLITKHGHFGLAPPETRWLDTVCILLGAPVPYVLRQVGSHFRLVGECFVDGVMHGEALRGLDTSVSSAEDAKNDLLKIQVFEIR